MSKAAHVSTNLEDGSSFHAVGVSALRVLIIQDGLTEWYAQGLDIDYLAQGEDLEAVKAAFEEGLRATIKEHLRLYGEITNLLVPASVDAWKEFYSHRTSDEFHLDVLSTHQFDFEADERIAVFTNEADEKAKADETPKPLQASRKKRIPFDGIQYFAAAS